jgi:signal transduction histidine kinase
MHKEPIKLLLVDDDPGDRKIVQMALAQSSDVADFNAETAETISETIECLKNKDYDVVLLDLGLPDSQGIDTVQKAHNANPNVPIVVLTGLVDEAKGLEAIEKGAEDYLVKENLLNHVLVRVIRYAIARKIAKKKIEEAIEAKSQFMSMVSHELRVPLASIKGIDLVLELDNSLPRVNFDKDRIIQVLSNLVNNAIKCTEQGSIIVATRCHEDLIQVSVRDTGVGIKKEDIPKLFHKFEQLVTEKRRAGTGLGLSISKEIIEKHNGKIWAESEPGQGSTFFFTLPKQKTDIVDNAELAVHQ